MKWSNNGTLWIQSIFPFLLLFFFTLLFLFWNWWHCRFNNRDMSANGKDSQLLTCGVEQWLPLGRALLTTGDHKTKQNPHCILQDWDKFPENMQEVLQCISFEKECIIIFQITKFTTTFFCKSPTETPTHSILLPNSTHSESKLCIFFPRIPKKEGFYLL